MDDMDGNIQNILSNEDYHTYKGYFEGIAVFLVILALEMPVESIKPIIQIQMILQIAILFSDFSYLLTQNINLQDFWLILSIFGTATSILMINMILANTSQLYFVGFTENNL